MVGSSLASLIMYCQYSIVASVFDAQVRVYFDQRLHVAATLFPDQIVQICETFMYIFKRWH